MRNFIICFVSLFFVLPSYSSNAAGVFQALKKTSKAAKELRKNVDEMKKYKQLKSKSPTTTNTHIDPSTYIYFYPFVAQPLRESSNLNEKLRKQKNDKCLKILKTLNSTPIFKKPDNKSTKIGNFSKGESVCLRKQTKTWIATNYGWIKEKYIMK